MYIATSSTRVPEGRGFNDLHWHEELQITLVTHGKLVIRVNGMDYELETGQAILINKGTLVFILEFTITFQQWNQVLVLRQICILYTNVGVMKTRM
ncbi:hypothetical protein BS614_20140 [Paenibacillus xylanexedens]|nr:hypothetical protein BS614_20140 [Paenibacillus xylanexedens]